MRSRMGLPRSLTVRVATRVAALAVALVIAGGAIGYQPPLRQ